MTSRAVVRTQLMRTTIHTVTAADALALRPLLQPVLDRTFSGTAWGQRLRGQDVAAWSPRPPDLLTERPMGRAELQRELARRHPGLDAEAVAFGVSYWVPWVQPPPRGLWSGVGRGGDGPGRRVAGRGRAGGRGRPRAPLPGRLRAGERPGHPGLVRADPAPRGGRPARPAAAALPDRGRRRAGRRPRWAAARPGHARARPVPRRVRQRRPVARGPVPRRGRGRPRPAAGRHRVAGRAPCWSTGCSGRRGRRAGGRTPWC